MDKKSVVIIILSVILVVGFGTIFYNNKEESNKNNNEHETSKNEIGDPTEALSFLSAIAGLQANNIEIINDPVGFKGELFAPREAILNGVEYFLENTENDKMEEVKVDIGEDYISIYVNYKVMNFIKTPIEVRVNPSLNSNEDLVIGVEDVKFLDLKIADWIVDIALNSFIKDWFPEESEIKVDFNKGNVVVHKDNFGGVYLKDLSIESEGLKINAIIDLEKILIPQI